MSVGLNVFLAHVLQEPLVSQLDGARICLDLEGLDVVIVGPPAGYDDSFFIPFSTDVVLNDNTVFYKLLPFLF